MGERSSGKKCLGMEGLVDFDGNVRDAALISAAQHVEHYKIAAYGTFCAFADLIGESRHALLRGKLLTKRR